MVRGLKSAVLTGLPLIVLALLLVLFTSGTITPLVSQGGAPLEKLEFERVVLEKGVIRAHVTNGGPSEVTIAQVLVNDAIWRAFYQPSPELPRLGRAVVVIAYDWVEGEPLKITMVTSNGFTFSHEVQIAVESPKPTMSQFLNFAVLGAYVGVIPVFLGLIWFPVLSKLKKHWYEFLLSFTVGLLLFLAVDALKEGIELTPKVPGPLQGTAVLVLGVAVSFLGLVAVSESSLSESRGSERGLLTLAYLVALGIGLHNLGEGLAIGAAYAVGEVSLGAFLILGFTMHNTTEGLAIIAPVSQTNPRLGHLALMGVLAGAPTIIGTWIGGFSFLPVLAVVFLGVGAGAILQVVYAIVVYMAEGKSTLTKLSEGHNFAGLVLGLLLMYLTGLFVS